MTKKWFAIAMLVLIAVSMTGCGPEEEVQAVVSEGFTAEEADAYWAADAIRKTLRKEAIRRDMVVVEWRGNWTGDEHLALFHGLTHSHDVKVGREILDLVERDQLVLKIQTDNSWGVIAVIPDNLQPGAKIVFNR